MTLIQSGRKKIRVKWIPFHFLSFKTTVKDFLGFVCLRLSFAIFLNWHTKVAEKLFHDSICNRQQISLNSLADMPAVL